MQNIEEFVISRVSKCILIYKILCITESKQIQPQTLTNWSQEQVATAIPFAETDKDVILFSWPESVPETKE